MEEEKKSWSGPVTNRISYLIARLVDFGSHVSQVLNDLLGVFGFTSARLATIRNQIKEIK